MSSNADATTMKLLASVIACTGETARVVAEMLNHDQLTPEQRQALRASLARSIHAIASVLEQTQPGSGEILTRTFRGYPVRGTGE